MYATLAVTFSNECNAEKNCARDASRAPIRQPDHFLSPSYAPGSHMLVFRPSYYMTAKDLKRQSPSTIICFTAGGVTLDFLVAL